MPSEIPKNFCLLPFTTMLVRADSTCSVCCLNSGTAKKENGEDFYLYQDSIKEAFHSPFFQELRASMLRGERHPSCVSCWETEDRGSPSKRTDDLMILKETLENFKNNILPDAPVDVSLNLGTMCNLKCRICGPQSSSKWPQEYLDLYGVDHIQRNNSTIQNMSPEESRALLINWPSRDPSFMNTLMEWLPHMVRLEFLGGEPFLNQKQFEIVKKSVEIGAAKNQLLHFVTNGSTYPEEAIREHWPHFKSVNVNISVDGIEDQFEYQRYGAKWEEVLANIERYQSIECVKLVQIYISISIFSIYYLPEMFLHWSKRGLTVCISIVTNPHRFDIRVIPPALKEKIKQKFSGAKLLLNPQLKQTLQTIEDFMMSEDKSELWPRTIENIWFHDKYRKQKFADFFPEFHEQAVKTEAWFDYETQKENFFPEMKKIL